ncbi:MAG TPA: DUF2278 family protein [Thermoleophilaceae bacterium]|nr:DUF2278 family protein [Thermoleophilaceae bacterium]
MPLAGYGVLTARAVDRRREGTGDTPHYQVHARDEGGVDYRLAINVKSQQAPSELLFLLDDDLHHPVTDAVTALGDGWHPLESKPGGASLDYVRANLFDPAKMRALPPDLEGPDNDLPDMLDHFVQRAIADPAARLHVFGQRWGPESDKRDKVFGFEPGNGVHDVHMNQGNSGGFERDDGVWQDGGLLFEFPGESRFVGVFLAFQSQAWHTDDTTGHTIGGAPSPSEPAVVQIVAAVVNPVGPAPERESVLLLNVSPEPVDLTGWKLADRQKATAPLPDGPLAAGETLRVEPAGAIQLGNNGGAITLLDAAGLKVTGVSYTGEQARREGWTVAF